MAQQVTSDTNLVSIYKTWYTEKRFPQLLFRNSPTLRKIQKNRVGGRAYNIAMLYGRGGATSGDYTVAVANAASSSRNAEMAVVPGNIHTVFTVTQKEILAASRGGNKGAYIKPLVNKMFAATEGTRKSFAACLFGFGCGDIGALPTAVAAAATTATLNADTIVKLDIGTQFYVTNGATPTSAFYDATVRTVSAIDGNTITWTGGGATAGGWAAGSIIELAGGRDATPAASMPTGFAGWIPSIANRSGATWTTYIGTAFYGVTRSVSTNSLAGWFYRRQPGELMIDALLQGIKLARRGGGVPDMIVVNDEDYMTIIGELHAQTAYMQQVNTAGAKNSPNQVVRGVSKMAFAFSTSWLDKLVDDPYCPQGTAYIIDSEVVEFAALSNTSPMDEGLPAENEPGAASVEAQNEPDTSFRMIIDDYLNVVPNSTSVEGPAAQVSMSVYGNFVVHEPGHCAVVVF
jgi:hypothetical protein